MKPYFHCITCVNSFRYFCAKKKENRHIFLTRFCGFYILYFEHACKKQSRYTNAQLWGSVHKDIFSIPYNDYKCLRSSVGRALGFYPNGHRFEPCCRRLFWKSKRNFKFIFFNPLVVVFVHCQFSPKQIKNLKYEIFVLPVIKLFHTLANVWLDAGAGFRWNQTV